MIAPDAELGAGVRIGAFVVIGARCKIGAGTAILPHVTIGSDVAIGKEGLFHPGVRVGDRVKIGDRVIVHANVVIGSDGFSFAPDLNSPTGFTADVVVTRIHSLGNVEIGDDVEIGAGTTIDRSTLGNHPHRPRHQNRQSGPYRPQCRHRRKLYPGRHGGDFGQRDHRQPRADRGARRHQ